MLFNSYTFFLFFLLYYLFFLVTYRKNTLFKAGTLFASFLFYSWSYPPYLILLIINILIHFLCGKKVDQSETDKHKKIYVIIGVASSLGLLAFFKYFNFFIETINIVVRKDLVSFWNIILPVGISFYTFQSMSYTIDVYRKKTPCEKSLLDFAVYVSFFPQLVAGPIVFARDFLYQLKTPRKINFDNFQRGLILILYGFLLKTVIADNLAVGVDHFFTYPQGFSQLSAWYYCYCYSFQIFGDFAGYSYIAIGIARLLDYEFPKNFDYPYLACTLSDFWRRWHISLSTWLKEYLYFSLGGNRCSAFRTKVNLMITMLLGGLWHGASWNFVIWGGIHGLGLGAERFLKSQFPMFYNKENIALKLIRVAITFHFVLFSWLFFRAANLNDVWLILNKLFIYDGNFDVVNLQSKLIFLMIAFIYIFAVFRARVSALIIGNKVIYAIIILIMIHIWITMGHSSSTFIYFKF